jgi:hypothetical protein
MLGKESVVVNKPNMERRIEVMGPQNHCKRKTIIKEYL